jgi:farnesyl-diphosphate farnesyltransferase
VPAGVVKLRRGLTARVFAECEGMSDLLTWFLEFLGQLQEKALLQVAHDDPTREVRQGRGRK